MASNNELPVSLLNQICSQNNLTPVYTMLAREGRSHAPTFTQKVELCGISEEGTGASKKKAKHIAARLMLKRMLKSDLMEIDYSQIDAINRCLKRCDEEDIAEGLVLTKQIVAKQQQQAIGGSGSHDGGDDDDISQMTAHPLIEVEIPNDEVNPVGKLHELCVKKHWPSPDYEDKGENGPPNEREFIMKCKIEGINIEVTGTGKTKKIAKRLAAQEMLGRLREDNLVRPDPLLDRLPTNAWKASTFDFIEEVRYITKNRAQQVVDEATLLRRFFDDLAANTEKMELLCGIFANDLKKYMIKYMDTDVIIPEVENLVERLEKLLNLKMDLSVLPEKRFNDNRYQCMGEFVALDAKYEALSIGASFATEKDLQRLKEKTMSRVIVVLLMFLVD